MFVRRRGVLVGVAAVLVRGDRVFLHRVVTAVVVMVRGLLVMVGGGRSRSGRCLSHLRAGR